MSSDLSQTLDELLETFDLLDTWDERYGYLIELGYQLPPLPPEAQIDAHRVEGCLSTVWLTANVREGNPLVLEFAADSDSVIVKGLLAVLLALYSGRTPGEILEADAEAVFQRIGLRQHLSPRRRNGLHAMVQRIRSLAAQHA